MDLISFVMLSDKEIKLTDPKPNLGSDEPTVTSTKFKRISRIKFCFSIR